MFCQNCGSELREGLNFCNRCGRRVFSELEKNSGQPPARDPVVQSLSNSTGFVGVAGVISFAILVGNLLRRDEISPSIFLLVLAFGLLIFGIVYLMLSHVWRLSNREVKPSKQTEIYQPPAAFDAKSDVPQIEEARTPFVSVTEHTTRTLESVPRAQTES